MMSAVISKDEAAISTGSIAMGVNAVLRSLFLLVPVVLVLLVVCPSVVAQETEPAQPPEGDDAQSPEETPTEEVPSAEAIALSEMARSVERANRELREFRNSLTPAAAVVEIPERLSQSIDAIEDLTAIHDPDGLEGYSLRRLDVLRQRWSRQKSQFDDWQTTMQGRIQKLEAERMQLREMSGVWEKTTANAVEKGIPGTLLEQITAVNTTIGQVSVELERRIASVLLLQGRVSETVNEITVALEQIDAARALARQRIFLPDSPPLWETLTSGGRRISIVDQIRDTWRQDTTQLREFVQQYRMQMVAHGLVFLILVGVMVVIRQRSRRWEIDEEDQALKASVRVFERPVAAAMIVALLNTRLFYPEAPIVVFELNLLLALAPLLRLLPRLIYRNMRPAIYGLGVLFALHQTHSLAVDDTLLQRLLLQLVTGLTLVGVIWVVRPGGAATAHESGRWWRATIVLGRLATIPLAVSFAANLWGSLALAELLTRATLKSIYGAVVLFAAVLVLGGLATVAMRSSATSQLRSINRHGDLIKRRTYTILRLVAVIVWVTGTLTFYKLTDPAVEGLSTMLSRRWTIGQIDISLGDIFSLVISIWLAVLISRFLRFILEEDVLPRVSLPRGVAPTLLMLLNYAILGIGIILGFAAAGIQMTQFALVAGALGVGIGFGLQNVVNNFISGLILVFERPIKVGDTIEVGQLIGEVRRIGMRSSTVRTYSGAEVIVPNGNLISSEVVNWTLSDRLRRIELPVGVAYGTDPEKVIELLIQAATAHKDTLRFPEPRALFLGFGESSLDFELRFWTSNFDFWREVASDVTVAINATLRDAEIEIPFPQRDLHLRSVDPGSAKTLRDSKAPSPALESDPAEH
jgi:small-conductance mechanosensitive channel